MKRKIFISISVTVLSLLLLPDAVDGDDKKKGEDGHKRGSSNNQERGGGGDRGRGTDRGRSQRGGNPGSGGDSHPSRGNRDQQQGRTSSVNVNRSGGGSQQTVRRSGGQNLSRNPSMSRPQVPQRNNYSNKPQRQFIQRTDQTPQQRHVQGRSATSSDLRRFQRSRDGSIKQHLQSDQQVRNFLQHSKAGRRAAGNFRSSPHRGNKEQSYDHIRQSLPHALNRQNETARDVRHRFHHKDRNWFNRGFWNDHGYYPHYWNNDANWWGPASWEGVNGWLDWGWNEPIYYQGGYPIYVTSETNYLLPDPVQYPQNITIITGGESLDMAPDDQGQVETDWMPLGVFALVNNVDQAAAANMVFQLTLSKDGGIAGSYYNTSSDQVYPVDGIVDRNTQMAIWKMSTGENAPIFQTGIFNLTKDQTAVDVTYSDGSEQTWLLIRLPEDSE